MAAVFMAMYIAGAVQPVSAGIEAECRQEAEEYGIAPELQNDYISGCIDSRGGVSATDVTEDNTVAPFDPEDDRNLGDEEETNAE